MVKGQTKKLLRRIVKQEWDLVCNINRRRTKWRSELCPYGRCRKMAADIERLFCIRHLDKRISATVEICIFTIYLWQWCDKGINLYLLEVLGPPCHSSPLVRVQLPLVLSSTTCHTPTSSFWNYIFVSTYIVYLLQNKVVSYIDGGQCAVLFDLHLMYISRSNHYNR